MTSRIIAALIAVAAAGTLTACGTEADFTTSQEAAKGQPKTQEYKLNLSHIECADYGVRVHFVLLFAGKTEPAALEGTWSGGAFGPVSAYKNSGNVWHYEVLLPSGYIEILGASVGGTTLHNPSEYSGDYQCGDVEQCEVVVEPQDLLCTDRPLGNPGAECAEFGLVPSGKDDGLSGLTFTATMDAYVALVKSGSGGCGPGNNAYRVYVGVQAGDELHTPVDQDISHVTYCDCAVE